MAAHDFGEVSDRLRKATVTIQTQEGRSSGSGVVWSADGTILTNAHVASAARATITLWDGSTFQAEAVSRDAFRDLAAVRIRTHDLAAPRFRDSDSVRAGEVVIAVGNPLGFTGALSTGVVHAVGSYQGLGRRHWVQAAVRLAPGNSGGPLADAEGNVIGINTMVANGLGLAIPSNALARFMDPKVGPRVQLGVTIRPVPVRAGKQPAVGLLVLEVNRESLAEAAALRAGDVLVGANGQVFESMDDLGDAIEMQAPTLRLDFVRPPERRMRKTTIPLERASPRVV